MPLFFFILFGLAVYAELAVIINVGEEIGAGLTLLAMIATAVIGLWLVRLQGFDVYRKLVKAAQTGKSPVEDMLHGLLLLFAGFLLIIPGFISDGIGALLLIPPIRALIISMGFWRYFSGFETKATRNQGKTTIIEGEYTEEEPSELDNPGIEPPHSGKRGKD